MLFFEANIYCSSILGIDIKLLNSFQLVEKKKTGLWLAEQLGKDKTTISKWCTNSSQPDVECLIKISKLLNVELSDILIVDNEEI